jgi:hypothetical protein
MCKHVKRTARFGFCVVRLLRSATLVFEPPHGNPITTNWWPKKSWHPVLRRLEIRARKFYATRHTFISDLLTRGEDLKAIAEYCGTSVAMIERSYRRWMPKGVDRGVRSLRALLASNTAMFDAKTGPFTGPQLKRAVGDGLTHGTGKGRGEWSHGESNISDDDPPETEESPVNLLESGASAASDDDQPNGKKRQE